jgi:hypothetical protein
MSEPVLHRLDVLLVTLVLPRGRLSMLLNILDFACVDIDFDFEQRIRGYLLVGVLSSLRPCVYSQVRLLVPRRHLSFIVDAYVTATLSVLESDDTSTEDEARCIFIVQKLAVGDDLPFLSLRTYIDFVTLKNGC